ncbi:MAG TPA: hypothetical protein VNC78_03205 [Actinomycetota bacterium]|nr:hypothetical protein [Actinomycetota bacterium]
MGLEASSAAEATTPKQAAVSVEEDLLASRRLLQVISELLSEESRDGDGPRPPVRLEALGMRVEPHARPHVENTSLAS